jgi:hypothetical protein
MACQPCFPKTCLCFTMLIVLFMWMGANKFVKAQVGRLPDDEGTSFSVYVYGFFQVDGNCNLWIEVPYSNKTE